MTCFDFSNGPELTEQQQSLCARNIARLQAFKANPPPAPQSDYKAKQLVTTIAEVSPPKRREYGPTQKERRAEKSRQRAAEHQKTFEPIRMTAAAPYPTPSLLDDSK
jgi:hypothetical protein